MKKCEQVTINKGRFVNKHYTDSDLTKAQKQFGVIARFDALAKFIL